MKKLLLFVLAATALAACSTDTTQDLAPEIPTAPDELQVSFDEEDTRIQLGDDGVPVWTKGDLISVFYRSNANSKYQFTGETGDADGSIKLVEEGVATQQTTQIVAVYPYSEDYWFNWNTGDVEAFLPAEQTYLKDSFGIGSSIMVSKSDYKQLSFKNVCGWLKLQFTGTGYVSKIVLKGNDGEQVAGEIYINTENASCVLASKMGSGEDVGGVIEEDNTVLTSVTLNCGDGVALNSETPTVFYIALPPQTFEKGFTATMYGCDGSTKEISTENLITIERNHILPMASATLEMPITNNVIWYTSSDGEIIEPYTKIIKTIFGANIVSNTYENGVGVITFDGDVTKIGDSAFYFCTKLTSITIPNSVTMIGKRTFEMCSKLTSVTIPDSVTKIGERAFWGCSALKSVTIGNSVSEIGSTAFQCCSTLNAFYGKFASADNRCLIVNGVLNSFAIGCGLTTYSIPDSVTEIGWGAFDSCTALTSVTIPNNVKSIGGWAFYGCSALTSITIPDSVTSIGDYAFSFCYILTSITIPDSVTTIGDSAFRGCSALKSVTIPDSVTTIGGYAFSGCNALKEVYCKPTTPPSLGGSYVFDSNASGRKIYVPTASVDAYKAADGWSEYADAIVAMPIPSNQIWYTSSDGNVVEPYATDVFGANITSNTYENGVGVITFDGDVTKIGYGAFQYCDALTSVTIPDSVISIGDYAFQACLALTSVTIGNNVTEIGYATFHSCISLTSITIPDSVTTIGEMAYCNCKALKAFYGKFASADNRGLIVDGVLNSFAPAELTTYSIPDNVTSIGDSVFGGCTALTSVTIPDSVTSIGNSAFRVCSSLTSVTIPDSVTTIGKQAFFYCTALKAFYGKFASEDNRCLIVDGVLNSFAPAGLTEYTIPDSVTTIGDYAFYNCSALTSITIPNSVTTIGNWAFQSCSALKSITIPDSVTTIGSEAFWGCSSLVNVTIGNSVTTIGSEAFYNCDALTSVTIGNSVTTIGDGAFDGCIALTSITIPDSVTTIGDGAFCDCIALTSITIPDSVTTIGGSAFHNCSALKTVYCKPTTPPSLGDSYVFDNNASDRKIYVPTASVDAYKAKQNWIEYADAIEPYNFAE